MDSWYHHSERVDTVICLGGRGFGGRGGGGRGGGGRGGYQGNYDTGPPEEVVGK